MTNESIEEAMKELIDSGQLPYLITYVVSTLSSHFLSLSLFFHHTSFSLTPSYHLL